MKYSCFSKINFINSFSKNGKIDSIIILSPDNKLFFFISDERTNDLINFINKLPFLISMYGESKIIKKIISKINKKLDHFNDYFVMMIKKNDFFFNHSLNENYYCKKCDEKDFKKLKRLQVLYHLEEVYKNNNLYPKQAEMAAFKEILKNRLIYAIYLKKSGKAVSKAYVNSESLDSIQIGGVYTDIKYRRLGLSQFCVNTLLKEAFKGKEKAFLFVNKNNNAAINLYLKIGFKVIAETTLCYF